MNEIVTVGTELIAPKEAFCEAPGVLGALIRSHGRGNALTPSLSVANEAMGRLAMLKSLCAPVPRDQALTWLRAISGSVAKGPTDLGLVVKACWSLIEACGEFPAGCWTDETRLMFVRTHRFWPLPYDLNEFMVPLAASLTRQLRGCQAVIDAWNGVGRPEERAVPRGPRSLAEINHVRERVLEVTGRAPISTGEHVSTLPFRPAPKPPVRTVEEQLAILNAGKAP